MNEQFWRDWFHDSYDCYRFGKHRENIRSLEQLVNWMRKCTLTGEPCYVSVQPANCLEKLFFDFDSKLASKNDAWAECLQVAYAIKREGAEPLIFDTGNRGYHLYAWIWDDPIQYSESERELAFEGYKQMVWTILNCDRTELKRRFRTLDPQPLHAKALGRLPYSIHEKTGRQMVPVDLNREVMSSVNLNFYRSHHFPREFIHDALIRASWVLSRRSEQPKIKKWNIGIRPCLENALHGHPPHDVRLAYVLDALYSGKTVDQIVDRFRVLEDFDEHVTRYQIENTIQRIKTMGIKPFRESTLKARGICDMSCAKKWYLRFA